VGCAAASTRTHRNILKAATKRTHNVLIGSTPEFSTRY
jgi:hypothetical protein